MNGTRHLSRVLLEILKAVPLADVASEGRLTLMELAAHLQDKAPEQIRHSQWDSAEFLIEEAIEELGEPEKAAAKAIWTGAKRPIKRHPFNEWEWEMNPIQPGDKVATFFSKGRVVLLAIRIDDVDRAGGSLGSRS